MKEIACKKDGCNYYFFSLDQACTSEMNLPTGPSYCPHSYPRIGLTWTRLL